MHASDGVALRHLLVDDATSCCHPLNIARSYGAAVAHAIAMFDGACQNVSDRLDPAVRMPRKSGQIILGNIVAEIIQQQERIELRGAAKAEGSAKVNSGSFERRLGLDEALHWANGHDDLRGRGLRKDSNIILDTLAFDAFNAVEDADSDFVRAGAPSGIERPYGRLLCRESHRATEIGARVAVAAPNRQVRMG